MLFSHMDEGSCEPLLTSGSAAKWNTVSTSWNRSKKLSNFFKSTLYREKRGSWSHLVRKLILPEDKLSKINTFSARLFVKIWSTMCEL